MSWEDRVQDWVASGVHLKSLTSNLKFQGTLVRDLRIAVDIDGVLADSMTPWAQVYTTMSQRRLEKKEIVTWGFWRELGLTNREFQSIFYRVWKDWDHVPPTEDNLGDKMRRLSSYGETDIVTGRTRNTVRYVEKWLEKHAINYRKLYAIPPHLTKVNSGHNVYVDDSPVVASQAASSGRTVLLYDQPWNRGLQPSPNIVRMRNLDDAARLLGEMHGYQPRA